MGFYEDEEDDDDDGRPALKEDAAKKLVAKTILESIHREIDHPRMIIHSGDPMNPAGEGMQLVQGGFEYFNDPSRRPANVIPGYSIDSLLSNDISTEEALRQLNPKTAVTSVAMPANTAPDSIRPVSTIPRISMNAGLQLLGLGFLCETPTVPHLQVQIGFTGAITIQVPFFCHHVVQNDNLVLLITDKRSVPLFNDMNFNFDRNTVQATLLCPDGTTISVLPPVPKTVSFEIGVLRCTMFVRVPA